MLKGCSNISKGSKGLACNGLRLQLSFENCVQIDYKKKLSLLIKFIYEITP